MRSLIMFLCLVSLAACDKAKPVLPKCGPGTTLKVNGDPLNCQPGPSGAQTCYFAQAIAKGMSRTYSARAYDGDGTECGPVGMGIDSLEGLNVDTRNGQIKLSAYQDVFDTDGKSSPVGIVNLRAGEASGQLIAFVAVNLQGRWRMSLPDGSSGTAEYVQDGHVLGTPCSPPQDKPCEAGKIDGKNVEIAIFKDGVRTVLKGALSDRNTMSGAWEGHGSWTLVRDGSAHEPTQL